MSPPSPPAAPDYKALAEEAQRKLTALEAKHRESETDRLNRLKADKARERAEEERRRNPVKYLQETLGDDWYDAATKLKAGTVSPAHVSTEMDARERRLEERFAERERALAEKLERLEQAEQDRSRQDLYARASQHAKGNPEKYRLTNLYGKTDDVGQLIEGHFKATSSRNPDGTWAPGEMWTEEQGAQALESYWTDIRKLVLDHENGRTAEPAPRLTIIPERGDGTPDTEPKDEEERRQRVRAAWAAAVAKRQPAQRPS